MFNAYFKSRTERIDEKKEVNGKTYRICNNNVFGYVIEESKAESPTDKRIVFSSNNIEDTKYVFERLGKTD